MTLKLRQYDLHWLEEPIFPPEDFQAIAKLRAGTGVAMAAGENNCTSFQFRDMLSVEAVDYAQPSVTKVGGVTMMRKVMDLAYAHGVEVVPHSAYFGPGLLASIHCIAAMPNGSLVERYDADFAENPLHDAIHPDKNGHIAVPQGPGLGLDPDMKVVEKLRIA